MNFSVGKTAKRFARSEEGATAIEYGLIAALISIAAIVAFQRLGGSVTNAFLSVNSDVEGVVNDMQSQRQPPAAGPVA